MRVNAAEPSVTISSAAAQGTRQISALPGGCAVSLRLVKVFGLRAAPTRLPARKFRRKCNGHTRVDKRRGRGGKALFRARRRHLSPRRKRKCRKFRPQSAER